MAGKPYGGKGSGGGGTKTYTKKIEITPLEEITKGENRIFPVRVKVLSGSWASSNTDVRIIDGGKELGREKTNSDGEIIFKKIIFKMGKEEQQKEVSFALTGTDASVEEKRTFTVPAITSTDAKKEDSPNLSVKHYGKDGRYTFHVLVEPRKAYEICIEEGNQLRQTIDTATDGTLEYDALPFKEEYRIFTFTLVGTKKKFQIRLDGPAKAKPKPITVPAGTGGKPATFSDKFRSIQQQLRNRKTQGRKP